MACRGKSTGADPYSIYRDFGMQKFPQCMNRYRLVPEHFGVRKLCLRSYGDLRTRQKQSL